MGKSRFVTKSEARRLLAAIKDPTLRNMVVMKLATGKANPTFGEAGAALASMRKRTRRKCGQCLKPFMGIATAKFCSNACRQKAKRSRQ